MKASMHRYQRGMALAVGLILLAAATIVTIAGMQGIQMQERMTSGQNNKTISLNAAEAGASRFFQEVSSMEENPEMWWEEGLWTEVIPSDEAQGNNFGAFGYYFIDPDDVDPGDNGVSVFVTGLAREGTETLARTRLHLELSLSSGSGATPHPAFGAGLLSDKNIRYNGSAIFNGSIHANEDFINNGDSILNDWIVTDGDGATVTNTSNITAAGAVDANITIWGSGDVLGGVDEVEVPSATAQISALVSDPNANVIESCNIPSGDGNGVIYFCSGNLTLRDDYSNVTILASGNITHRGSSSFNVNNNENDFAIIAGGNVTLSGSSSTFGIVWAEGNITQNGSHVLNGSMVARGNIRFNGSALYTQDDRFSSSIPLPRGQQSGGLRIARWQRSD